MHTEIFNTPTETGNRLRNGADMVAHALAQSGVSLSFIEDHPDTKPLYHAFKNSGRIVAVRPISDISCVPMADIAARYSGAPVAAVTSGEGRCLNQIMGMTTAWGDKSPVVSIGIVREPATCSSPVYDREKTHPGASFNAISLYCERITSVEEIREVVRRGLTEAQSGRGGPVHVDVLHSVLLQAIDDFDVEQRESCREPYVVQKISPPAADPVTINAALDLLRKAKRPIIFAGGGTVRAGACKEINEFSIKTGIPLLSSMGALGAADRESPTHVGPPSYLSGEAFHYAITNADLCLAVGTCFSGLDGFGLPPLWSGKMRFIQINIDHQYIGLNPKAELAIIADARQALRQLLELLTAAGPFPDRSAWLEELKKRNREHEKRILKEAAGHAGANGRFHPAALMCALREKLAESDALVVMDGGNTALWAGMLCKTTEPNQAFFPFGMATLGVGIPMALALKMAAPDRPVVLISGDGALLFNIQELELVKRYGIPVIIIVNNDSSWNMMKLGEVMLHRAISAGLPGQDYAAVARSFGIDSVRLARLEDLPLLIERNMRSKTSILIDVPTDSDAYPDSLASFIRVEMMGSLFPQPFKKLRRIGRSALKWNRNTMNLVKYLFKTI